MTGDFIPLGVAAKGVIVSLDQRRRMASQHLRAQLQGSVMIIRMDERDVRQKRKEQREMRQKAQEQTEWLISQDRAAILAHMHRLAARVGYQEMRNFVSGALAGTEERVRT